MAGVDRHAPRAFLATGYAPHDWVAILLKSYRTGEAVQRVLPVATVASERFQAWLRAKNAQRWEVYVSTNAVAPGQRSRTRDRVAAVRHLFLDADEAGQQLLSELTRRPDVPRPSCVLATSPGRIQTLWRVRGFDIARAEALQKHLAKELGADRAATSAAQLTRLPGFFNYKRRDPFAVSLLFGAVGRVYESRDFPDARLPPCAKAAPSARREGASTVARARSYLRSVPAAVAGERGDVHTFRVCCRVVRGFALSEYDALAALDEWNERCVPPWRTGELAAKVRNAARYGREPIGNRVFLGHGVPASGVAPGSPARVLHDIVRRSCWRDNARAVSPVRSLPVTERRNRLDQRVRPVANLSDSRERQMADEGELATQVGD